MKENSAWVPWCDGVRGKREYVCMCEERRNVCGGEWGSGGLGRRLTYKAEMKVC